MATYQRGDGNHWVATIVVDDQKSVDEQAWCVNNVFSWLQASRVILTDAIIYTTMALAQPQRVPRLYWECLYYYFGIPYQDPRLGTYQGDLNTILGKLVATSCGLNSDVHIVDTDQMDGMAGFLYRTLKTKEEQQSIFGAVMTWPHEKIAKMVRESLGTPKTFDPVESPIYINLAKQRLKRQPITGVLTMIHEATHKYVRTIDAQYFDEVTDIYKMYTEEILKRAELRRIMGRSHDGAAVIEGVRKSIETRLGSAAVTNVRNMPRTDALNNADGLARYAHSVASFPPAVIGNEFLTLKSTDKAQEKAHQ